MDARDAKESRKDAKQGDERKSLWRAKFLAYPDDSRAVPARSRRTIQGLRRIADFWTFANHSGDDQRT